MITEADRFQIGIILGDKIDWEDEDLLAADIKITSWLMPYEEHDYDSASERCAELREQNPCNSYTMHLLDEYKNPVSPVSIVKIYRALK